VKKTVVVGISSGIAAYKSLELINLLKEEGIEVLVIMTAHASQMVPVDDFAKASGNRVLLDLFAKGFDYKEVLKNRKVDHIELADRADLLVIVPATANCIGKIAHGIADDFLTTTVLATTAPILLFPSMNVNMWNNPIVQENITLLKESGYHIIEPTEGMLACGYEGKGRLEEVAVIKNEILHQLRRTKSLAGKKIIVTAGGTLEKIDEVRYLTNKSSGKMGVALAEECFLRGGEVLLLRANSAVKPRYHMPEETFDTADELFSIIKNEVPNADMIFHAAAVSDFQLCQKIQGKISSKSPLNLALTPRLKIADHIKKLNPKIKLIAFKAEHGLPESELIDEAFEKLQECQADAVVANDISRKDRGFQADTNEVIVVLKDKKQKKFPLNSKRAIAASLVDFFIEALHI